MKFKNSIIVFDLDGTLTKRDTYLPFLLGYLFRHPWRFIRTLHLPFAVLIHLLGLRSNSWLKQVFLKACMGDLSRKSLIPWVKNFTQSLLHSGLRAGAIKKLHQYKKDGATLVLVSASLDIYVEEIGYSLGFKHIICTQVKWDENDCLMGELLTENCYGHEKVRRIIKWLRENQQEHVDIAYTDHHSDLPLLQWANVGVAVNPTEKLRLVSQETQIEMETW